MKGEFGTIIQIGDVLVSEDVVMEYFACDYPVCKGQCCISGDAGAPLEENEPEILEKNYPIFQKEMRRKGRDAVRLNGFFEIDRDGDMVTPLSVGGDECAYTHFTPEGECLCAIEKCGCKKPVSCSLYPIRVTRLTGGGQALNLHRWDICKCAFEKGRREGIKVYQFLKKSIVDNYGQEFWEALDQAARHISQN